MHGGLAQASERTVPREQEATASIPREPGFLRSKVYDKLPVDIGTLLTATQSATQTATRSLAGFMSGESDWIALVSPNPNRNPDRNPDQIAQPEAQRNTEPTEEARVFRFSVGGFKVYHRKTPKTDS
jgi:hypothetical protein